MPSCEICDNRGWVLVADGGSGSARPCTCRTSPPIQDLLRRSRMEAEEIAAALEPWDESAMPRPSFVEEFARSKATAPDQGPWALVLLSASSPGAKAADGASGRGKTKAASMALRAWCEATGRPGLWVNVPEAISRVMEERLADGYSETEACIRQSPFLVLDDLGFERATGPRAEAVAEWLHYRQRRRSPTVIPSNATDVDQLGDGRIASRLGEAEVVILAGPYDYREFRQERSA